MAEPWTTRRLLAWMEGAFRERGIDEPRLCARMLVAHVLACDAMRLYLDPDRPAAAEELARLRDLTGRALRHEPVQYLVGEGWFFGMPFHVDRRALIPRPSTETIVEHLLQHERRAGRDAEGPIIADVCTGTGCVAIALASRLPRARVLAVDISPEALELARSNSERHRVHDRVESLAGDLLGPIEARVGAGGLDYLVANPPYISDAEWADVPPNVKLHEPELALRAGADGLDLVRPLLERGPALVRGGGLLLVEVAMSHADAAREIAARATSADRVRVLRDSDDLPRVIRVECG